MWSVANMLNLILTQSRDYSMQLATPFFSHSHGTSEIVTLTLQESYSLSVLLYAAPAFTSQHKQTDEMNACWNNVFRKIFGYRRSESVKDVIYSLGRVNFKYLLLLHRPTVKFYKRLYLKPGLLHDVFWSFMIFNCDECMRTVFILLHKVICCASSMTMCLW